MLLFILRCIRLDIVYAIDNDIGCSKNKVTAYIDSAVFCYRKLPIRALFLSKLGFYTNANVVFGYEIKLNDNKCCSRYFLVLAIAREHYKLVIYNSNYLQLLTA